MKSINILSVLAGLAISSAVSAQVGSTKVTTTAVPFLRATADARSSGMGDVTTASTVDANATFYNAAKLPFASSSFGVGATYTPWMREIATDMFMGSLAAYKKLGDGQALSLGFRYFSMGTVEELDYNGTFLKSSMPREFAIDVAYSRKVSDKNAVSLSGRYIHSNLGTGMGYKAASAVAADISFFHNGLTEAGKGWTWGLAVTNLGTKISYMDGGREDFLPANLSVGLGYRFKFNEDNALQISGDVRKLLVPSVPLDSTAVSAYTSKSVLGGVAESFNSYRQLTLNAGAEYSYKNQFMLRAGYSASTPEEGSRNYATAGAGVNFSSFQLNFSYLVPFNQTGGRNPLSNTMRFGLIYQSKK